MPQSALKSPTPQSPAPKLSVVKTAAVKPTAVKPAAVKSTTVKTAAAKPAAAKASTAKASPAKSTAAKPKAAKSSGPKSSASKSPGPNVFALNPPAPARPALAAHDARNLLKWRPAHLLLLLLALMGGGAAYRMVEASGHFVEGGIQVETEGTKGEIEGGELLLDLPLRVFNGTDANVVTVNMWLEALACPSWNAPDRDCTRLHSSEQMIPMRVSAGSSGSENQQMRTGLPGKIAGDYIRVNRRLIGVTSDVEAAESRQAQM